MNWESISKIVRDTCIKQLGTVGQISRVVTRGTLDINTGIISADIVQLLPVDLVMTGRRDLFGSAGVLSRVWASSAVIASSSVEPVPGDTLIVGGYYYTIGEVLEQSPDGVTVISYDVELRG